MSNKKLKIHLKELMAKDKFSKVLDILLEISKNIDDLDFSDSMILLSAKWNNIKSDKNKGTLSQDNLNIETAKLRVSLLHYIEELSEFPKINYLLKKEDKNHSEINISGNGKTVIDNVDATVNINGVKQKTTEMGNHINNQGENNNNLQGINTGGGDLVIGGTINKSSTKEKEEKKEEKRTKILFLAANPSDEARIATDREYKIVKDRLNNGEDRDNFDFLQPEFALDVQQLVVAMNQKPDIVHFSGHGEMEGILITNSQNESQLMPLRALKRLFRQHKDSTQLVVLNSCYSAEQAETLSGLGFYVIGMNTQVEDTASLSFAGGLYIGLAAGKAVEMAYDDAMIVLETDFPNLSEIPEIWKDGKKLDL